MTATSKHYLLNMTIQKSFSLIKSMISMVVIVFTCQSYALTSDQAVAADALSYPGVVRLTLPNNYFDFWGLPIYECSAIVLEPKRILTTAGCVSETILVPGLPVTRPIDAQFFRVHSAADGEIGGTKTAPAVQQSLLPNIKITDVFIHPQNSISIAQIAGIEYDLAILYLEEEIGVFPSVLYNGQHQFNNDGVDALGWVEETRIENSTLTYYNILSKVNISISQLAGRITLLGTDNPSNIFGSMDLAMPAYKIINGRNTIIGLRTGGPFQNGGQRYVNISLMDDFIKLHAPGTQFWDESSAAPTAKQLIPPLQLLLNQ